MTPSLLLALTWLIAANFLGMMPSRNSHWRRAYVLIALGVPLLIWVFWQNGFWIGAAVTIAAASIFRWPLIYAWRWIRTRLGMAPAPDAAPETARSDAGQGPGGAA